MRSGRAPRVVLIVDQPQRDLAGLVLTALELCRQGVVCHLVGASPRWREIWALRPDFVLQFNLRSTQEALARFMPEAGIGFGLLDTEGAIWHTFQDYTSMLIPDRRLIRGADVACTWGPAFARELLAGDWFGADQVSVTGCPRFDFYHPDWQPAFTSNGSRAGADAARHVLVTTNYSDANSRFLDEAGVYRELTEYCGLSREQIAERLENQRRAVQEAIRLVRSLAADFPTRTVVVRPHPFEGVDVYREAFEGLPNVRLNTTGSALPHVLRAVAVLQRGSTMAIEARIAGVPALSPLWLPLPFPQMPIIESVSTPIDSYEQLRAAIGDAYAGRLVGSPENDRKAAAIIHDLFFRIDGESHTRVAAAIGAQLTRPRSRSIDEKLCRRLLYGLLPEPEPLRRRLGKRLRHALRVSPDWSFRGMRETESGDSEWLRTSQHFDAPQVQELVVRIRATAQAKGRALPAVDVRASRDRSEYTRGYAGHAVMLEPSAA
jgi:surface carbohydrate biosynthesis protein